MEHRKTVMIQAFASSKLDYCKSLLYGLSEKHISHFSIVRTQLLSWLLRLQERGSDTVTPILHKLHWLPIQKPIISKIFLITYKVLSSLAPKHLSDLLNIHQPVRSLRSNVNHNNLQLHRLILKTKNYIRDSRFLIIHACSLEQSPFRGE